MGLVRVVVMQSVLILGVSSAAPPPAVDAPGPAESPALSAAQIMKGFTLSLSAKDGERSRDSHSSRYEVTITGTDVAYYGPYGPSRRGQSAHGKIEFKLTAAQAQRLVKAVREHPFPEHFEQLTSTKFTGPYVKTRLDYVDQGQTHRFAVEGMERIWGRSRRTTRAEVIAQAKGEPGAAETLPKAETISAEAIAQLEKITALRRVLTSIAQAHGFGP